MDKEKDFIVHKTTSLRRSSSRIILSFASTTNFKLWSQDINEAYVQSDQPLQRTVYPNPPKQLNLPNGTKLKLRKPLYRLCDAGEYWQRTLNRHSRNELRLKPVPADQSMYIPQDDYVHCILGSHVDDMICCGDEKFLERCSKTKKYLRPKQNSSTHSNYLPFLL